MKLKSRRGRSRCGEAPPTGYRMPAEFELHKATWLAWAHSWECRARNLQAQIVDALHEGEEVHILINNDEELRNAQKLIKEYATLDNVFFRNIVHDDMWIRDYGPTFINNRTAQACVDWLFDGWGKQEPSEWNDLVPRKIANALGLKCYSFLDFAVEGGAIDVNGKGTCMISDSLTNPIIRYPAPTRQQVEIAFKAYIGVTHFIWLEGHIPGDTYTYGHIDSLARFINANTIALAYQPNPKGPGYEMLEHNYQILRNARDQKGNPFNIVRVPVTSDPAYPSTYLNFFIGNDVVLQPIFNDPRDAEAVNIIQSVFPTRTVVPLDCSWITTWGGEIHCITLQQPAS